MNKPTTIPVDLEKLMQSLHGKLPVTRVVAMEQRPYLELWNCSVQHYLYPITKKKDHYRSMKLRWLSNGNTGLIEYIEPYIKNKKKFEVIRKIILAIK